MRQMKDSGIEWIGQIPQEWEIAKVKNIYSFQTGWTPSTSNAAYFDGSLPWANISDIGKERVVYDTSKHITEEAVANSSMEISPEGSLMYSFKLSVGDVSFCGTDMYTNEAIATFLPSEKYDLRYLYYAAPLFIIKNANENIYGAKLLNQDLIKNATILDIPYDDQVSISDYLDAKCTEIDALIAAKEKTNALLRERRQSIIYEAVTKGLNPDAPMKDSGIEWIGEIPAHWGFSKLKYDAYMKGRIGWQGLKADEFIEEGPYLVTGTDFEDGKIQWERSYHISDERFDEAPEIHLQEQDLLITKDGTIGKLAYVDYLPGPASLNSHLLVIRPKNKRFINKYLYWVLSSDVFLQYTEYAQDGTIMASLSQEKISRFVFGLPSIAEQQAIVDYLDNRCEEMDSLISDNEATIQKLKEYRQSIIYEAVTGKIEI